MPPLVCPKCRQALDDVRPHCRDSHCHWARHRCGAVIDLRHPARHIPYEPRRTKETP